jgi:hypothetical protein
LNTTTGIISGTPTAAAASASYNVTASNASGSTSHTLTFAVADASSGEVKITGTTETPVLGLSSPAPASGDSITATVTASGATHIDLTTTGSGCGSVAALSGSASPLTQTGTVAASGQCEVSAAVTTASGTSIYTTQFTVVPSAALPGQGLSINGGTYFPSGDASLLGSSSAASIDSVSVPQSLINGGTATMLVTPSSTTMPVTRAIVRFSQVPGYYSVPVTVDATSGNIQIQLQASTDFLNQLQATGSARSTRVRTQTRRITAPTNAKIAIERHAQDVRAAGANSNTITATVNLVGPDGGLGAPATASIPVQGVGSGPIQVSFSWVGPVDLDLHVVPPSGEEIYYGHRADATGGTLDLDSNAACAIDNVNNENIVWSNSTTPASGTYTVRVDYWDNCGLSQSIPYTVRVTNCGVSKSYSGTFTAGQADQGGAGAGTQVTTFDYQSCNGLSVAGTAKYDDYVPLPSGFLSASPRALPIRYASVEVHASSDDSVLATGQTDENGQYSITFSMTTPGKYYVKVLASQSLNWLTEKVVDNTGAIYAIKTPDQDASTTPIATGIDLNAQRNGTFAETFHIFDVGVNALKQVQAQFNATLPALTWRWPVDGDACGAGSNASCFHSQDNSINVLSIATDTDEYDDTVLAHEFGHFALSQLSKFNRVGGPHSLQSYSNPQIAWNEGAATFVGQSIVQTPTYIDTHPSGAPAGFMYNIETLPSYTKPGTSDGSLSGNVDEATVSAILWDLADSGQDSTVVNGVTYTDKIANPTGVFTTLASWKSKTHDRGASGPDLVDFIDEWLCQIPSSSWEATPGDNLNGLVSKLNAFPYAPQPLPPNCN